jgi:cytochrome c-type biogenesis protein CcmF
MHVPIAIIIGLLNGLSLLLKWNQTKGEDIIKKSIFSVSSALVVTVLIVIFGGITDIMMIILSFSAAFALFVNVEIAIQIIKGNMKMIGAYISHIGIALFILGVIGSAAYSKEVNIDLIKNVPQEAFGYQLTFTGWHPVENNTKYAFNVEMKKGNKNYKISPIMYISDYSNGLMREPAILSTFTKDIYVSPLGYEDQNNQDAGQAASLKIGDKINFNGLEILYKDFVKPDMSVMMNGGDFQMGTDLTITKDGKTYNAEPTIKRDQNGFNYIPATIKEADLKIELKKIDPSTQKADFVLSKLDKETKAPAKEVLTVEASVKPFINFVWGGVLVLVFGFFVSVARRLKESLIK